MEKVANILANLPARDEDEAFETIASGQDVRIERIISRGHRSADNFWYEQDWQEWVLVITGAATVILEDGAEIYDLGPGDYINIPALCRHRVEWTDPDQDTVWLAVHYHPVAAVTVEP